MNSQRIEMFDKQHLILWAGNGVTRLMVFCLSFFMGILPGWTQSGSTVNFSASVGQKPILSQTGSVLPNGNPVWLGAMDNLPASGLSDRELLEFLMLNWKPFASTTIRSLPLPSFPGSGLFAASAFDQSPGRYVGQKTYWLIFQLKSPATGTFPLEDVVGVGLFSSTRANWKFPDPGLPAPGNATSLFSDEVDQAYLGEIKDLGLQLKPVTIEGPLLGLPEIPNGYVITTTPIPNAQNLDSAIRTFYGTDNPAPGAAIASQLNPPGGSPQDSIQLNFETSVPTVLTSILSVATPSAHTIFKSGIEVEIFVPVTFSGMDQIGTVDGPLQMVFQPLMGPSPGQLDPEANDPLILVETPASPPIPGLRKFTARSHFDSILSSDSNGKAWVSLQWTISQSMPDGIQLGAIRLITQDLQKRARILSISRAAETIELEIDAAAGARLFIESSPDLRNWADFTSLNPTQPTTTVILPADGLPDTIFFRAHQGVNR